jgi:S1-C subfamily serine protease
VQPSNAQPPLYRLGVYTSPVNLSPPGYAPVIGLYINSVVPNGAAAAIQLDPGDIITRVNGYRVTTPAELSQALQGGGPTVTIRIRNVRTGQFQDMTANLTYY